MSRAERRRRRPLVNGCVVVVLTALLAGCASHAGGGATTTSVLAGPGPSTSVVPTTLAGTTRGGGLSFLGAVERIPVAAVAPGRTTTTLPPAGTPAYQKVVSVAYRQFGSGKPLLMIGGEDTSMEAFSPALLHTLAGHYRVTIFDLPGVGYSGPPTAAVTVSWLADATAGLVVELGLSSPIVLGWGLGGQIALALAERHPGLAGSLVLVDTGLDVPGARPPSGAVEAQLASPRITATALAGLMFPAGQQAAATAWLAAVATEPPDVVTGPAVAAEAAAEAAVWRSRLLVSGLSKLDLPSLVVGGEDDTVFPMADSVALAAALPGARRYLWPGAGYGDLEQSPAVALSVLEEFTG